MQGMAYLKQNRQITVIFLLCVALFITAIVLSLTTGSDGLSSQSTQSSKNLDEKNGAGTDQHSESNSSHVSLSSNQSSSNDQNSSTVIVQVQTSGISKTDTNSGAGGYSFTKGDIGIENDQFHGSSTMNLPGTGTCSYLFSQNGSVVVERSNTITNSETCEIHMPTTEFAAGQTYQYVIEFTGDDGVSSAHQITSDIIFK